MARRRLSDATRWQIIGMSNAGLSGREISRRLGYSQSVICRLLNKFQQTNHVQDRARSGRPRKTSRREDGTLMRLVRRFPFLTSTVVMQRWLPNRPLSTRTVRNRLRASGYRARWPIRRPMLTPGQKAARLYWCQQRRNWNIRSWRKKSLVGWKSVSSPYDGLPCACLEAAKYCLFSKVHPGNCSFRWRLNNGMGMCIAWL